MEVIIVYLELEPNAILFSVTLSPIRVNFIES